jgi:hypothetical protein
MHGKKKKGNDKGGIKSGTKQANLDHLIVYTKQLAGGI